MRCRRWWHEAATLTMNSGSQTAAASYCIRRTDGNHEIRRADRRVDVCRSSRMVGNQAHCGNGCTLKPTVIQGGLPAPKNFSVVKGSANSRSRDIPFTPDVASHSTSSRSDLYLGYRNLRYGKSLTKKVIFALSLATGSTVFAGKPEFTALRVLDDNLPVCPVGCCL